MNKSRRRCRHRWSHLPIWFRPAANRPRVRLLYGARRLFSTISLTCVLGLALLPGMALGQEGAPPPQGGDNMGPPPMEGRRPPMERAFHVGPRGRWWNNPDLAQKLSLTSDQQKKMDA